MPTIDDLRGALQAREQEPPTLSELLDAVRLRSSTPGSAQQPTRARRRSVAILVACVAVAVVAVGAVVLSNRPEAVGPATIWNSNSPGYSTAYLFGPDSAPGFQLYDAGLDATGQSFEYITVGHTLVDRDLEINVFTMTTAARGPLRTMTPVTVGAVQGYFQTTPLTAKGLLGTLFGAAPPGKYAGTTVPDESVVAWPLNDSLWATLTATHGTTSDRQLNQVFAPTQLVAYASRLRPVHYDHAAPVKVGYLPAGLHFGSAAGQPETHAIDYPGESYDVNTKDPTDGAAGGSSEYHLTFVDAGTTKSDVLTDPLVVEVIDGRESDFATNTPTNPPALIFPGPWKRTSIHGHLAWESPRDVLIQVGSRQLGIWTPLRAPGQSAGLVSEGDLIKVAQSLVLPNQSTFADGLPLLTSLPAGAF